MRFPLNIRDTLSLARTTSERPFMSTTPKEFTMLAPRPLLSSSAVRAHELKNCLAIVCAVNKLVESEVGELAQRRLSRSQQAVRRMVALLDEDLRPPNSLPTKEQADCVSAAQILEEVHRRVVDL